MEDIIREKYISSSPDSVSFNGTKQIIDQMNNSVCRIFNNGNGTGFFTKIPYGSKFLPVLITNNHVINNNDISNKKTISLYLNNDKITKTIKLDKNRKIYTDEQLDVTIIEIKENEDNLNNKYLELDDEIISYFKLNKKENPNYINNIYSNKSIYLINYPEDNDVAVSYGKPPILDELNKSKIYHYCTTKEGSSGSPILLIKNQKLIGIHYGSSKNYEYNNGTLLIYSIIEFSKKIKIEDKTIIATNESERVKNFDENSTSNIIDNNYNDKIRDRDIKKDLLDEKTSSNDGGISDKKMDKTIEKDSKLNTIIQILTSIKEIKSNFFNLENNLNEAYKAKIFGKLCSIYALISFSQNILSENHTKIILLEHLNIIFNFLNKDIFKLNTCDFLLFILNILHEELISYPGSGLISFKSQFINDISKSKEQFINYYSTQYLKSIISDLFNWIRREERFCSYCDSVDSIDKNQKFTYSFQAFPIILFDIDEIAEYAKKQRLCDAKPKSFNLQDMFNIYSLIPYKLDKEKEKCIFCKNGCLSVNYYIETSPKYFIIVINRKEKIGFTYGNKFELKEEKKKGIHYEYKKYELISVIMKDRDKCSCAVKNCEYIEITDPKEKKKITYEEWIKFQDENVKNITFENDKNNNKEIYDPYNAKILVYKGIKAN